MKLARLFVIALSIAAFGGCVVTTPEIKFKPHAGPPGQFCPPGQAKKGNC